MHGHTGCAGTASTQSLICQLQFGSGDSSQRMPPNSRNTSHFPSSVSVIHHLLYRRCLALRVFVVLWVHVLEERRLEPNGCFAQPLGGCLAWRTDQFCLPDPRRPIEPFKAAGADPGQRGGAGRPVGPQADHQPGSGLRDADSLHHQSHTGKRTPSRLQ